MSTLQPNQDDWNARVFRRAGKTRGTYLAWLDMRIAEAKEHGDLNAEEALLEVRKAFTEEFYP